MRQLIGWSALIPSLLVSYPADAAPVPPDAGQSSRELQKLPASNAPKAAEPLLIKGDTTPKGAANNELRFAVKAIHVTDSSAYAAPVLEALVADLIGSEHSLAELDAGAARITDYYRANGYVVARAYLPAQDIKDGVVVISVLEGRVGEQRVDNKSRLSDAHVNGYLSGIKSGDALQAKPVDRALLLLNDTPGVGGARASLQPGASVGTSDLIVELTPSAPYTGSVELDNYGNRYTGEYRLGAALAINSPFKLGDQLSVRALTSNRNLNYARVAYQLPVGGSGLRAGAAFSDTRYKLGKEFTVLQAHGTASSSSLYAVYPFIRSEVSNLSGTLTWEDKKLNDQTDAPVTATDKHVQLANLGLAGNHQDAFGGAAVNSFDLSLVSGRLSMDATSRAVDAATTKSNGSFERLAYSLNRQQRLTDTNTLSLALSGQQANKNLNSSEQFSLGGANGVRAYPQGEGVGDQGWLLNLEVRHSFNTLQGVVFYDAGAVKISHTPYLTTANTRNIAGAGLGVNAQYKIVQLKTSVAWRTKGGQPQSEPLSINRNPRLWLQLSGAF